MTDTERLERHVNKLIVLLRDQTVTLDSLVATLDDQADVLRQIISLPLTGAQAARLHAAHDQFAAACRRCGLVPTRVRVAGHVS